MVDGYEKYKQEVHRRLRCTGSVKRGLLRRFGEYHSTTADNSPRTYEQMVADFGPPEEMAHTLMQEVPSIRHTVYRWRKWSLRILAGVLITVFLLFTGYIYYIKSIGITVKTTVTVVDSTEEAEEQQ